MAIFSPLSGLSAPSGDSLISRCGSLAAPSAFAVDPLREKHLKAVAEKMADPLAYLLKEYGVVEMTMDPLEIVEVPGEVANQRVHILHDKLQKLGPGFTKLVVDHGILLRIDEFISFASKKYSDPWLARSAFSQHLGTQKFYRSLWLSKEELAKIETSGMDSLLLRYRGEVYNRPDTSAQFPDWFFNLANSRYAILDEMIYGLGGQLKVRKDPPALNWTTAPSPFLSFTKFPQIAEWMLSLHEKVWLTKDPNRNLPVVFEIIVPVLDVIPRYDNPLFISDTPVNSTVQVQMDSGETYTIPADNDMESFALFSIAPTHLRAVPKDELPSLSPRLK
ncbi:MAG: hypothetical protein K2X47_11490 [Bdellovibrionales bacterium]|nr:hypothetical protein [Bdellovibrionales bacterium]